MNTIDHKNPDWHALLKDDIKDQQLKILVKYVNDVNMHCHRYYFNNHFDEIKKEGFFNYKNQMIDALEYVEAYEYIDIVDFHFESLYNSMCIYEESLESSDRVEEKDSQCRQLFKDVDNLYESNSNRLEEKLIQKIEQIA